MDNYRKSLEESITQIETLGRLRDNLKEYIMGIIENLYDNGARFSFDKYPVMYDDPVCSCTTDIDNICRDDKYGGVLTAHITVYSKYGRHNTSTPIFLLEPHIIYKIADSLISSLEYNDDDDDLPF